MTNPTTIKVTGLLTMPLAGTKGRSSGGESCAACLPTGDAPKALRRLLRAVRRACQRCSICHPYERPWRAPSQVCLKAYLFLPCIRPPFGCEMDLGKEWPARSGGGAALSALPVLLALGLRQLLRSLLAASLDAASLGSRTPALLVPACSTVTCHYFMTPYGLYWCKVL